MHPEQTLSNMSVDELVSYSETFSEVPSRVAQALTEKMVEMTLELQEKEDEIEGLNQEINDLGCDNDSLRAAMRAIDDELDQANLNLDKIKENLNSSI